MKMKYWKETRAMFAISLMAMVVVECSCAWRANQQHVDRTLRMNVDDDFAFVEGHFKASNSLSKNEIAILLGDVWGNNYQVDMEQSIFRARLLEPKDIMISAFLKRAQQAGLRVLQLQITLRAQRGEGGTLEVEPTGQRFELVPVPLKDAVSGIQTIQVVLENPDQVILVSR